MRTLQPALVQPDVAVCELGGANSCFIDDFLNLPTLAKYHIIDNNAYGLRLAGERLAKNPRVTTELADALGIASARADYDVVYSVGLIEHFDTAGTARCIDAHFALCRPGGMVLITFPTPTLPYWTIRLSAEAMGIWAFPDERPLRFGEVASTCARHGTVQHQSINWWIGLTQGYVLTRKSSNRPKAV